MSIDAAIIERLDKDLKKGASMMNRDEARFLVDAYYSKQADRIRIQGQLRSVSQGQDNAPALVLEWLLGQAHMLEKQLALALKHYALGHPVGRWATDIRGVGPVIAASLLAHIDIERAPTAGAIWRFAGLDANREWYSSQQAASIVSEYVEGKQPTLEEVHMIAELHDRNHESLVRFSTTNKEGDKIPLTRTTLSKALSRRPHNADLKTLCWKIGESFVKVSGSEDSFYGQHYLKRKAKERVKNEKGDYADQAKAVLEKKNIGTTTDAYKAYSQGKLPKAHIHARAKRYAVKLFLAHFHHVYYEWFFQEPPPKPYAIAILGHKQYILPPTEG